MKEPILSPVYTLPLLDGRIAFMQSPMDLTEEDLEMLDTSFKVIKKCLETRQLQEESEERKTG